jgi:O-antigen/teichoic acid export membrane protein
VTDFGTENLFLRNLARADSHTQRTALLARFGVFRAAALSIGVPLYALAVVAILHGPLRDVDFLPVLLLLTSGAAGYAFTYYQSKMQMGLAARIVLRVTVLTMLVVLAVRPEQMALQLLVLVAFELAIAIALLASVTAGASLAWKDVAEHASLFTMRAVARESMPLAMVALLVVAYSRLDVLVIGPIAGPIALGLYSYAYRVSEPFRFIGAAADSTLYSYVSAHLDVPGKGVQISRMFGIVVVYSTVLAIAAVLTAGFLVWFGYSQYRAAMPTVVVLGGALFVRCINGFLVALLYARAQYTAVLRIALCNALAMAAIIYPSVAAFGILGAAAALLLVEVLNCLLQARLVLAGAAHTAECDRSSV